MHRATTVANLGMVEPPPSRSGKGTVLLMVTSATTVAVITMWRVYAVPSKGPRHNRNPLHRTTRVLLKRAMAPPSTHSVLSQWRRSTDKISSPSTTTYTTR